MTSYLIKNDLPVTYKNTENCFRYHIGDKLEILLMLKYKKLIIFIFSNFIN